MKDVTLIAGPTASGKSGLALRLARENGAIIVNADSMQVYDVLSLLTARPQADELAQATHRLYGHRDPREAYSTGAWLREAEEVVLSEGSDRPLIFVGGTGLYFRALCEGLSPMPEIPDDIRKKWRDALEKDGAEVLHARLSELDHETAARLESGGRPEDCSGAGGARGLRQIDPLLAGAARPSVNRLQQCKEDHPRA